MKLSVPHFTSIQTDEIRGVSHSLAQRSALANGDLVTLLNTESWRNVRGEVLVSLLISGVLGDEVEVFSADDQSSVHLGGNDGAGEDTASNRDHTGEGAFLVCRTERVLLDHTFSFPISSIVMACSFFPITSFEL